MQWKAKYTRPEITPGSTKLKRVFAWLPKYIDGTMVWFEYYELLLQYIVTTQAANIDGQDVTFKNGEFITISARLCK